jgi:hypothetical protein
MGKQRQLNRERFESLTAEEKRAHTNKIARYRVKGSLDLCPFCGRPTAGFIPKGLTMREAGICAC